MKKSLEFFKDPWMYAGFFTALMVIAPIIVIFVSSAGFDQEIWLHIREHMLFELFLNTAKLCSGVLLLTLLFGVSLAFLTAFFDFPLRRFFSWALLFPLAVPGYVFAFVYLGILDFTGPVQTLLRDFFPGLSGNFPEIRSVWGVILIMSFAFYPYVFMLSYSGFSTGSANITEAARSLGAGKFKIFSKIILPLSRPWIFSGLLLVMMETLADFGTVSVFNFNTFTTAIYKSWFSLFSFETATRLSSLLIVFVFAVVFLEQASRRRMRYSGGRADRKLKRIKLKGIKAFAAFFWCGLIFFLAFIVPIIQLLIWSLSSLLENNGYGYGELILKTLILAGSGALLTIFAALILSSFNRTYKGVAGSIITRLSVLGYAIPGTVLAVGVVIIVSYMDNFFIYIQKLIGITEPSQILQGAVFTMIIAYMIRFLSSAFGPVSGSMERITESMDNAARSMGAGRLKILFSIHLPVMKTGIFTGLTLVFVEIMKEMPLTLMTRPFGWDTLAVKIFELTSEGEWERAAIPALVLILAGIIPVILMTRQRS
jgi:iron(III) transport system permease protein